MTIARTTLYASMVFLCLAVAGSSPVLGQAFGNIVGTVVDASGAKVPGAKVTATNPERGILREGITNETGAYQFTAVQPGDYQVSAEGSGFGKVTKKATVEVGNSVTADFTLQIAQNVTAVEVSAEALGINLVDSKVDGIIAPSQVADLPLNGRNPYELAKLVPGIRESATQGNNNEIAIASGSGKGSTRFSIDGLSVVDASGMSGSSINLAQDMVQEFQVSVNNGDASMGVTAGSEVNLVTRSGTNALHGSMDGYFRNNQYAGYPGLSRIPLLPNPTNDPSIANQNYNLTSPEFYRRQFGEALSGRIIKDKLFWLGSAQETDELSQVYFSANSNDLTAFTHNTPQPRNRLTQNDRVDYRANDKNSFFWRWTWDRLNIDKPCCIGPSLQTTWVIERAYAAMMAWTYVIKPTLVNDVRAGFDRFQDVEDADPAGLPTPAVDMAKQFAPSLPALGAAGISGTNLNFGLNPTGRTTAMAPRAQISDHLTYSHGKHTMSFGGNVEKIGTWIFWESEWPYNTLLFNPTQARAAGISVPATYTTIADLLQLPVSDISLGTGHPIYPDNYYLPDDIRYQNYLKFYGQDSYKVTPHLTLNLGLTWTYDGNTFNWDIPKPQSMSKILGGDLSPTPIKKTQFSPLVGFAWDPLGHGKTVIRGGWGLYFNPVSPKQTRLERALLAPLGDAYLPVDGAALTNPLTGKGSLSFANAAANKAAGVVRLIDLLPFINGMRQNLLNTVFTGTNTSLATTNFDFFKGTTPGNLSSVQTNEIISPDARPLYSIQTNIGFQQQLGNDWLVGVSGVYDVTDHIGYNYDANLFNRPTAQGGPLDSNLHTVLFLQTAGKAVYKAVFVNARKRFAQHYTVQAAYTLSRNTSTQSSLVDLSPGAGYKGANYGYDSTDQPQIFDLSLSWELPWGFQAAFVNDMRSALPLNVTLNGIDLNGDGTTNDLLPGVPVNSLNRSTSRSDLLAAVANFNTTYAGKKDARGSNIPAINLPSSFQTGDSTLSQDVRITKKFKFREKYSVNLMAECFNIFNFANLAYASSAGNILSSGFGQATGRTSNNTLGSGGPRAFQFGFRFAF